MPISKKLYEDMKKTKIDEYGIKSSDFLNKENRTLLYGYEINRSTTHIYMLNEEIHYLNYDFKKEIKIYETLKAFTDVHIPSKRSYPESTDPEFLKLAIENGIEICFTTYDEKRYEKIKDDIFQGDIF